MREMTLDEVYHISHTTSSFFTLKGGCMIRESRAERIARLTVKQFPSLLASGVNVQQLVGFVLTKRNTLERLRLQKIGDDAPDYANTTYFIRRLSKKDLVAVSHLKRSEIRQRLTKGTSPFSRLSKKARETLAYLPTSWVYGSADWLLRSR